MKREFLSSSSSSSSSSPSSSSSSPSSSSSSRDVSLKASIDILLDSLDGEDGGHHGLAAGSSCLLILRGLAHNVSIHHEDSRETNSIIGQSIKTILNKEMMRIIKKVMTMMMMSLILTVYNDAAVNSHGIYILYLLLHTSSLSISIYLCMYLTIYMLVHVHITATTTDIPSYIAVRSRDAIESSHCW